jgi:hypothetical protein
MAENQLSKAVSVALNSLETREDASKSSPSLNAQEKHRLTLVSFWDITPGSRVLEIGCGQGDCTVVLADAVGENGHVDAVDPGAPDYGMPFISTQPLVLFFFQIFVDSLFISILLYSNFSRNSISFQLTNLGAPYTLSQCQSAIKKSPLGSRITFHCASTEAFLSSLPTTHQPYDFIILCHSIY